MWSRHVTERRRVPSDSDEDLDDKHDPEKGLIWHLTQQVCAFVFTSQFLFTNVTSLIVVVVVVFPGSPDLLLRVLQRENSALHILQFGFLEKTSARAFLHPFTHIGLSHVYMNLQRDANKSHSAITLTMISNMIWRNQCHKKSQPK